MGALAIRRFADTITRRRQGPSDYDQYGEWAEGAVEDTEMAASVQPLALDDADIVGGVSLVERRRVYVPEPDALAAAFEDSVADRVLIDGKEYVVEESRSWPTHTRATLLRQT